MELRKHQVEALQSLEIANEGIIQLPTGTGKTFIQANAICNNIENAKKWIINNKYNVIPVFTILTPRILLTNQIFIEVKSILINMGQDAHYLIVHSGKTNDKSRENYPDNFPYRQLKSTTSAAVIIEEYNKALNENVPLIIFGTYDSAIRIKQSGIPVYMLCADEAHYLVSKEFSYIADEKWNADNYFTAYRKYYFTATLRETDSTDGLGMNNNNRFGPILNTKTPKEMIEAGEILRPRIHLIDLVEDTKSDDITKNVKAIIEGFKEHLIHVRIGAKVLVVTKGSEDLNNIVNHKNMKTFLEISPKLKIFDISSAYCPRINGNIVAREDFFNQLRTMNDYDEAIIFHINILTEGIDVQGITAILPMNIMGTGKFLQTLGRASRLYVNDRTKLYNKEIKWDELERFVKPYAWIIMPIYGIIGEDLRAKFTEIIYSLRDYGFRSGEDVVIKDNKGKVMPLSLESLNIKNTKAKNLLEGLINIEHTIEEEEKANQLAIEDFNDANYVKKLSIEDTIKELISLF